MPLVIAHDLSVRAPASRVWEVITDVDHYPEWNPFVVHCASTLAVGDPIEMRVRVLPFFSQPQREWILENETGRRLCYGIAGMPLGALASRRSHEVSSDGPGRARYVSRFELSGWLAPLVALLLGRALKRGFTAMSTALVERAERLG
jgi:hypothetical protein